MNDAHHTMIATKPEHSLASVSAYLDGLWKQILRVPFVNPKDDFFLLGGDSALVIEMLMTISAHYDREFDYNQFFPKPNLRALCEIVAAKLNSSHDEFHA